MVDSSVHFKSLITSREAFGKSFTNNKPVCIKKVISGFIKDDIELYEFANSVSSYLQDKYLSNSTKCRNYKKVVLKVEISYGTN